MGYTSGYKVYRVTLDMHCAFNELLYYIFYYIPQQAFIATTTTFLKYAMRSILCSYLYSHLAAYLTNLFTFTEASKYCDNLYHCSFTVCLQCACVYEFLSTEPSGNELLMKVLRS